jgi:hypothetical protein
MNSIPQDNPRKMSQLEYAKAIQEAQGPQARVTWLTVAELIDLLEAQPVMIRLSEFAEVTQ